LGYFIKGLPLGGYIESDVDVTGAELGKVIRSIINYQYLFILFT